MALRKSEHLAITVTCDHAPKHSAVFAGSLPAPAEVSRVLKVQGCRYNGDTLAKDPIFAPPPPPAMESAVEGAISTQGVPESAEENAGTETEIKAEEPEQTAEPPQPKGRR